MRISGDLSSNPLVSSGGTCLLLNSSCIAMSGLWSILSGFIYIESYGAGHLWDTYSIWGQLKLSSQCVRSRDFYFK